MPDSAVTERAIHEVAASREVFVRFAPKASRPMMRPPNKRVRSSTRTRMVFGTTKCRRAMTDPRPTSTAEDARSRRSPLRSRRGSLGNSGE